MLLRSAITYILETVIFRELAAVLKWLKIKKQEEMRLSFQYKNVCFALKY